MICFPNAKVNLGLNVVSKREDGYHNLETIFYPIPVRDALEIIVREEATEDRFYSEGLDLGIDSNSNLVVRAVQLLREHYTFPPIDIYLLKRIPFGAGIGGGSADAAFMLRLLNDTFNLNIDNKELATLAVNIGADCPFFVYNTPMYAEGIGEKMQPVDISLEGYHMVLIKPHIHVSTKDAFGEIVPSNPSVSLKEVKDMPLEKWRDAMSNDFEKTVFKKHPQIAEVKNRLYEEGAIYASMTGTGASVYGIFENTFESHSYYKENDFYTFFEILL